MALRQVRVGAHKDVFQYDDGDFAAAIETDHFIRVSAIPVIGDDIVRLDDLSGGVGSVLTSGAIIADHALVRGDGGARGTQDTGIAVDDADNMDMNGGNIGNVGTVDGRDVSADGGKLDGVEAGADVTDIANINVAIGGLAGISNNDLLQWNDPGSTLVAKDIAEILLGQNVSVGTIKITGIKSGATQAAAGAAADEVWKTNGHASLPDNVLMIGV